MHVAAPTVASYKRLMHDKARTREGGREGQGRARVRARAGHNVDLVVSEILFLPWVHMVSHL